MYDFHSFINVKVMAQNVVLFIKKKKKNVVLVTLPYELEKNVYSALIG